MGQARHHHLARHLGRQQPVAVLGENRQHPNGIIDAKADKLAEQRVILHLFHQLAFGSDREQDLEQAGLAQFAAQGR